MTGEDIHALAGAYAMNALTEPERTEFVRHLAHCDTCAAEAKELAEIVARLADGAWSVPPPRLRERVLAEVRETRQLPPRRPTETAPVRRPTTWARRAAYGLAAGVLALAVGATTYVVMQERLDRQVQETRAENARIQQVLSAPDAVLRTTTVQGGGRMTVVMSPSQNAGVVVLDQLANPGVDRAYQLWLVKGTNPASAAVYAAGDGSGTRLITGVVGQDTLAITQEPAGGSQAPTLPVLAGIPMT
jgi:hypothetical protein